MRILRQSAKWVGVAGLAALTTLGISQVAAAADGIKAAYVETVIPSKTFSGLMTVSNFGNLATTGPTQTGVFGISSIVLTNSDIQADEVLIGIPSLGGAACGTSSFGGYMGPPLYIYVPAQSSLVIPFPTPYVINPAGGQACIAIEASGFASYAGQIQVMVTGVIN
jgi:hypothetical protein